MNQPEKSKQYSLKDKKKHEDGATVAVNLACHKDIVAAAEYNESFSWKWLVCLSRMSVVTSDFNHPSKDYINYISTDLSAEMMSTQNDGQNNGRWNRGFRSYIKIETLFQHHQCNFFLLIF